MHSKISLLAQTVPDGRVFGMDTQTLIQVGITLLNGIFLAVVLGFILYKPVKKFMEERSNKIQGEIDESKATMDKAKELIAVYDVKIEEIDKERLEILESARIKATEESKAILEEAKLEANELKKRSLESISADKERLKEETRVYIIDIASLMAQKYIAGNIDNETQGRLFEEALAQMEDS